MKRSVNFWYIFKPWDLIYPRVSTHLVALGGLESQSPFLWDLDSSRMLLAFSSRLRTESNFFLCWDRELWPLFA